MFPSHEILQLIVLGLGGVFILVTWVWLGWILLDRIWDDIRHRH